MHPIIFEPVVKTLQHHAAPEEAWLWCALCRRFFQRKHAAVNCFGSREACPFDDCSGQMFDLDILVWNACRRDDDPRWPTSEAELAHGLRSPDAPAKGADDAAPLP